MFPGVFQFAVDSEQHCDIAGGSSDEIGDGLCDKNTVDTETEQHWQADGQGKNNDDLPEDRKEDSLSGSGQRDIGGLARKLQGHHEDSKEIKL